jgi:hypothetical protein
LKIIASIDGSKFLAELTVGEIEYLAGRKIGADRGFYGTERTITSGTTFNIVKAFDQIHRNEQRKREVETVRATLMGIVNTLDLIGPFIEEPKPEPPAEVQP